MTSVFVLFHSSHRFFFFQAEDGIRDLTVTSDVCSSDLIDAVWGETPPKAALASLQNAISAVRKALGPTGQSLLRTLPTRSYVLDVNGDSLDLREFELGRASCRERE